MKQQARAATGGLALAAVLALSACGATTQASGPLDTLVGLETKSYNTIAPVTTPPTTAPTADSAEAQKTTTPTSYKVQKGDYWAKIAKQYGIELQDLLDFNDATAQTVIHAGDEVNIPPGAAVGGTSSSSSSSGSSSSGSSSSSGDTESTEDSSSEGDGCTYKIVLNDNPSKVAKKFGITVAELEAANSATVYKPFLVGSELTIPAPAKC